VADGSVSGARAPRASRRVRPTAAGATRRPEARGELAGRLRAAGLRATAARVSILAALAARPHAGTEAVIGDVRRELGTVSPQAVYHALGSLAAAGLVRRIEPAGSPALYERRVGDNHHHVVCRGCGAVADVDCAVGRRPCLTPSDAHGYVLDEAEVTFWGLCPDCQRATAGPVVRGRRRSASTPPGAA
jgi:Fe2+ or Zn2+ uptake regulation protein